MVKQSVRLARFLKGLSVLVVFAGLLLSGLAYAAPKMSMSVVAEKEVVEVTEKGKKIKKRVLAENTSPGDVLFMTISYNNSGDESVKNAKIDNPIPAGTVFKANSAWGDDADVYYSVDDAKTFDKPGKLRVTSVNKKGKEVTKKAKPDQYDAVRWVVSEIPAGKTGQVGFSVVVQ
jgi:uncharacterized repeat protein (TIGR01451 family)